MVQSELKFSENLEKPEEANGERAKTTKRSKSKTRRIHIEQTMIYFNVSEFKIAWLFGKRLAGMNFNKYSVIEGTSKPSIQCVFRCISVETEKGNMEITIEMHSFRCWQTKNFTFFFLLDVQCSMHSMFYRFEFSV